MDDSTYKIIHEFWVKRSNKQDFLWRDLSTLNYKCVEQYLSNNKVVLDLGAGDCVMTSLIANNVKHVTAVDYAPIIKTISNPKISVICCPIESYTDLNKYDIITIFGVMNYVQNPEKVYRACKERLSDEGVLLIKHQCCKTTDKEIISNIDGDKYVAMYRHYEYDIKILTNLGFKVTVSDPYPPEYNSWPDTFFKLFTCTL